MYRTIVLPFLAIAASAVVCIAEDFRVESTVFEEKQKAPVYQNSTVFQAGIVYDYLVDPPRTAVLDVARNRYILLDETRHERTEISLNDINVFVSSMEDMATKASNGFLKFTAKPKFVTTWNESEQQVTFVAPAMTYSVRYESIPKDSTIASQYREFSDWTARLSAVMNPAVRPPFPRIVVNGELAEKNAFPESVELTIPKQIALRGRGLTMRSEHVLTRRLLQKDLDQVAETGTQMASFRLVPFAEFRKRQPQ